MGIKIRIKLRIIPCNGTICPMVIDKTQSNRTNRIKLGYLIVILPVRGSLDGRTLPLHGIVVVELFLGRYVIGSLKL